MVYIVSLYSMNKETSQTCLDHIWASHICLCRPGQKVDACYNVVIEPNNTIFGLLKEIEGFRLICNRGNCWCTVSHSLFPLCFATPAYKVHVIVLPEHRAGLAGQGPASPHSDPNRRTCAWAAESHFPPLPALWTSCCGPASSLPNQYTHSVTTCN